MKRPTLRERLLSKAIINFETGCWEWTARKNIHGYGSISISSRAHGAHRVAYELIEGPIPAGLVLDHLCCVRRCINPAHLEPVTQRENVRRTLGKHNTEPSLCPSGHALTPDNIYGSKDNCRACNRSAAARYRAANREKTNASSRAYKLRMRIARQAEREDGAL